MSFPRGIKKVSIIIIILNTYNTFNTNKAEYKSLPLS